MTRSEAISLAPIARPSGTLAMVANDQRESLRTMLSHARGTPISDDEVSDFKVQVASALAPLASGMLFDRVFAGPARTTVAAAWPRCGQIVAVDMLQQVPGQIVTDTELDEDADLAALRASGVVGLKFLVLWNGSSNAASCLAKAQRFVEMTHDAGLIAILEGMVRSPGDSEQAWDRNTAIAKAAAFLGGSYPDLYKADVPSFGCGPAEEITRWSERITSSLPCPWVVLSNGVAIADFPDAVRAACAGGASGFLAGRAIWADCLYDTQQRLASVSMPRLRDLARIVDEHAQPWHAARTA